MDKNGNNVNGETTRVEAAADGNAVTFLTNGVVPGATGAQDFPTYRAERQAQGWSTEGLLPSATAGRYAAVLGWNGDLSETFVIGRNSLKEQGNAYIESNPGGSLKSLGEAPEESTHYVGSSDDGSTVVFESFGELAPGTTEEYSNVYAWDRATGQVRTVSVLNNGEPASKIGSFAGSYPWFISGSEPKAEIGGAALEYYTQAEHVVDTSGDSAVFTAAAEQAPQVFLRKNPTAAQGALNAQEECTEPMAACTVEVSASQRAVPDPEGPRPAQFQFATSRGSQVFFTSSAKLTDAATTGTKDEGSDLYRYDVASGTLTDLVPDTNTETENGAEVRGVLGISDDGAYVYFAANGVLAPGARPGDCTAGGFTSLAGECNLYLWHEGEPAQFIARLDVSGDESPGISDARDWAPTPLTQGDLLEAATARVTPDGRTLLFRSQNQLTGYENRGVPEFYRFRVGGGAPACVTCDPIGVAPAGDPTLSSIEINHAPAVTSSSSLVRNLSVSGDRVFFETPDALVPADTNGDAGCPNVRNYGGGGSLSPACLDVYEWESAGEGSCTVVSSSFSAQDGGCIFLISTGKSPEPSYLADASESGDDVFFFTTESLVAQDTDELADVYDARVGGGIASQNETAVESCVGEGCKGSPQTSPLLQQPASATFSGFGNSAPPPVPVKPEVKTLTLTQKLEAALKTCRRVKSKSKRLSCEQQARRRYGAKPKRKAKAKRKEGK